MSRSEIKAIIFDYFGVISSDEYWKFVKHGRKADTEFREYTDEVNIGKMHWQDFIQKVANATGTTVEDVQTMYQTEKVNPLIISLISDLRQRYKTALLTNANHEFIDALLQRYHLDKLFDVTVISSRLGIIKPDPEIFRYTLRQLGTRAEESVYIDDMERHVNAAASLGVKTILYKDFAQMKRELGKLLDS